MKLGQEDGTANYEYVTARVRSRRSSLFDESDYRKLVRMGPSEIARFMEESEYEREMNALGTRFSGVDLIEYALNENLVKHFDDVLDWAEGELYDYIARYLRKFDAWNVKTVIRGIYSGATSTEIDDDLIEAGELSDELLGRLVESNSIENVIELLSGTLFGDALEDAYELYEAEGILVPLENAVDRAYYANLQSNLPRNPNRAEKLYIEFVQAEVDFRNLRNALRIARSGADIDPVEFYIEGGRLFDEDELRQLANNPEELVARVRDSTYGDELDEALTELDGAQNLIGFEHALDAALLEYSHTLSNRYPLSVCPVLAYVLAKEREVDNIRAIARGREAGLSPEEIETELVTV
ncbi:V-type ATP synthase subunit C [Halosegnis rubeus]|jgi:V/A-type H+-transporting ATPase subunit C|uniref:A-type ATP synthase subunit C n=1 Tax=Halosegnis rubeus TaxID=2212850 RepID=A0A5N5U219_9EURY|nr:V-type ATP synthase subunit C [Halosegnis rubeus]KAB7512557.1 V-type ATP synthase subunit C [Halosegnis rubeus]KAB7514492.1 V-type ATP synthase subunit C [Halosegnis rubeus]KAB7517818.1 V-type ATP synthase subunit C [Halosegnis rubeus]